MFDTYPILVEHKCSILIRMDLTSSLFLIPLNFAPLCLWFLAKKNTDAKLGDLSSMSTLAKSWACVLVWPIHRTFLKKVEKGVLWAMRSIVVFMDRRLWLPDH
jgi:hypothetical protein